MIKAKGIRQVLKKGNTTYLFRKKKCFEKKKFLYMEFSLNVLGTEAFLLHHKTFLTCSCSVVALCIVMCIV